MESLSKSKSYEVSATINKGLGSFYGGFADAGQTVETISRIYKKDGYLVDTHTAVAAKVYEDYKKNTKDETPTLIASTASAYKFAESAAAALGLPDEKDGFDYVNALHKATGVKIPKALYGLAEKEILHTGVLNTGEMLGAVEKSLANKR
jgi:threonine synthase